MPDMRITFAKYDKLMPLVELKKSKHQRNKHPKEQIERLAKIMREHGVRHPIHISKLSGEVCFGHGRWEAARLNKWKEYPIVYQDFKSDDEEYACVQSDNGIAAWAELDLPAINEDLIRLGDTFDIELLGIEGLELIGPSVEPGCDEDEMPEHVEPNARLGDIYQLGEHRLICGDSTSIDAVDLLMDGEKADMVFTDPPYGMNLDTDYSKMPRGGKKYSKVIGDDRAFDPNAIFAVEAERYCIWGADWFYGKMPDGFSPIVWDKQPHHTVAGTQNHFELCWVRPSEKRRIIRKLWTGFTAKEKGEDRVHPTQKPVEVCVDLMERGGANVLDLFGGSGSTLIACEKTNRKCFMMEIDPHYVDVIVARWEKYTGKKAELINGQTKEGHIRRPSKAAGGN